MLYVPMITRRAVRRGFGAISALASILALACLNSAQHTPVQSAWSRGNFAIAGLETQSSTLADVQRILGANEPHVLGDGSEARTVICFFLPSEKQVIFFETDASVPRHGQLTAFGFSYEEDYDQIRLCGKYTGPIDVHTQSGIFLGMTRDAFLRVLGATTLLTSGVAEPVDNDVRIELIGLNVFILLRARFAGQEARGGVLRYFYAKRTPALQ